MIRTLDSDTQDIQFLSVKCCSVAPILVVAGDNDVAFEQVPIGERVLKSIRVRNVGNVEADVSKLIWALFVCFVLRELVLN